MLHAHSLVCDTHKLNSMKSSFLEQFEMLNTHLLKYIPNQPEAKWCTLPQCLQGYGVSLPKILAKRIQEFIKFPNELKPKNWKATANNICPNTTGTFQPGISDVCLQLSKHVTLVQLTNLIQELDEFQRPLLSQLEMLVFFRLRRCTMFDRYVHLQVQLIAQNLQSQTEIAATRASDIPNPSMVLSHTSVVDQKLNLPIERFVEGLVNVQLILLKILSGDADYSEITANGTLNLESVDIQNEILVLKGYASLIMEDSNGLSAVQNMLELFRYSHYIQVIHTVCTKCGLIGCCKDENLTKLIDIANGLKSENERVKLTPNTATKTLTEVKRILCFSNDTDLKCLDIFAKILDSKVFYDFIKEKKLYGEGGVDIFNQQYQLITAHLQHEEYDEDVLNHLYAAYKLIIPFMDDEQNLVSLMSKVQALDVKNGLKQLETVNTNIMQIKLWFLRAEVSDLKDFKHLNVCMHAIIYIFLE